METKTLFGYLKHNLKVTPQRTAVLELIIMLIPPTAEEIANQIKDTYPNMSFVRFTRSLINLLLQASEKMNTNNGIMRYDAVKKSTIIFIPLIRSGIDDYYDSNSVSLIIILKIRSFLISK